MATKTVATRLDPEMIDRLEKVARVDRRSVAQVMALLIERGLPAWEDEIEAKARGYTPSADQPIIPPAPSLEKRPSVADKVVRSAIRRAKLARE
jgi:hypothetical protein